jgi:predicted Zn-dependent protease
VSEELFRLSPSDPYSGYMYAAALLDRGKFDEAIALCAAILRENRSLYPPCMIMAAAYERKGAPDSAAAVLRLCREQVADDEGKRAIDAELTRLGRPPRR